MKRAILRVLDSRVFEVLIYGVVFLLNLRLCLLQTQKFSDLTVHLAYIEQYFHHDFYLPHPLLHILVHGLAQVTGMSDATAMAALMAGLSVVSIVVSKLVLRHYCPMFGHRSVHLFAALAANTFVAIFIPAYNPTPYLGQWSPNIWHSPTMALLKPLAILGFWGTVTCLASSNRARRGLVALTSLCLLLSTLAKPSFMICFIPAVGLFLVAFHATERHLWKAVAILFLPSVAVLAWQFLRTYTPWAAPTYFQDHIILTNFAVTRMYAPSVLVSSLLVLAFPLSVLTVLRGQVLHNPPLLLSYILAFVGFLQGSFLAEQNKLNQGAFVFGYVISLFMAYLFSLIEYLRWMHPLNKANVAWAWKAVVSLILVAHVMSGLVYWRSLVLGQAVL